MARSLSNSTHLAAALSESVALLINRRGYSAAAAAAVRAEEKVAVMKNKKVGGASESSAASSWVPDPITGYYRPSNRTVEVDPAQLREMLLSQRSQH